MKKFTKPNNIHRLIILLITPVIPFAANADSITELNNSATTAPNYLINSDGSIIIGNNGYPSDGFGPQPVIWNQAGIMTALDSSLFSGAAYSYDNSANAISADGKTVVGVVNSNQGFIWTKDNGITYINPTDGYATPYAVNGDGSVAAGSYSSGQAFYWTQNSGIIQLGTLGGTSSMARGINTPGTIIIGESTINNGSSHAFKWTQLGGMIDLGTLGGENSSALAISADGSIIIGTSNFADSTSNSAVLWKNGIINSLGFNGTPCAISPDGAVIVGYNENGAFIWDSSHGMRYLFALLSEQGINMNNWGSLISASGVGFDGTNYYISGYAAIPNPNPTMGVTDKGFIITLSASAVPEPTNYGLIGTGSIAIIILIRRRNKTRNHQS